MEEWENELKNIRNEINEIDEKIILLIKKRTDLAPKVVDLKLKLNKPIDDNHREEEIKRRIYHLCEKYSLDKDVVWFIINKLIEYNKDIQREYVKNSSIKNKK